MEDGLLDLPHISHEVIAGCSKSDNPSTHLEKSATEHTFSLPRLAWAIQQGASSESVGKHIQAHQADSWHSTQKKLREVLVSPANRPCFPVLYFAIRQNMPDTVRILCEAGADPNQRMRPLGSYVAEPVGIDGTAVPLLAYAVMLSEHSESGTDDTVNALLGMGASPGDVPEVLWKNYIRAPMRSSLDSFVASNKESSWCTLEQGDAIRRNLTLGKRYSLWKAEQIEQQTLRSEQLARADKVTLLAELPYQVIGQPQAVLQVVNGIRTHAHWKSKKPFVFLFTGPSGHGKSEMANRLGALLSLEFLRIDCTTMTGPNELFGISAQWLKSEITTPLNDHLKRWDKEKKRAVVFLDEFDKTTQNVRNALLLPLDDGKYNDPQSTNKVVDCTRVIWILAANIGVHSIFKFWRENLEHQDPFKPKEAAFDKLQEEVESRVIDAFGAPLTGRINQIVPFLPFDKGEQAVAAYKFIRDIQIQGEGSVSIADNVLLRRIDLVIVDDGQLATYVAKKRYTFETGARPLENAVLMEIGSKVMKKFFNEEGEVKDEMNLKPKLKYKVRVTTANSGVEEVRVESAS